MSTRGILVVRALLSLLAATSARAEVVAIDDNADVLDLAKWKPRMVVVADGKGHYLAIHPIYLRSGADYENERVWWGDGKQFWVLDEQMAERKSDGTFSQGFYDPRTEIRSDVAYTKPKTTIRCDDRTTEFTPLPVDEQKRMLDTAVFHGKLWRRAPYALSRDDRGTYYYVDAISSDNRFKSWRVFSGPKGKMKLQKLTNIVSDSGGDIFSTRSGELRLIVEKSETVWVSGKKRSPLKRLEIGDNIRLIYVELGVYAGERLGVPCDEL